MSLWPSASRLAARMRARVAGTRRLRERAATLELLQKIANAANESSSSDEALRRAIHEICAATGWPVGHVYVRESGFPQLAPRPLWHLDDPERWEDFVRLSDALHFVAGHGLPGRVLERGEPVWLDPRTKNPSFPRAAIAHELGIRAAFAFPVVVAGEVAAVLEFFTTEALRPDDQLTELAGPIAVQLGRVFERERAQAALRASEERFRSLVANVPGAIYRVSAELGVRAVDFVSDDIEDIVGHPAADFVSGRVRGEDVIHPEDLDAVDRAMAEAIENGSPISLEYRVLHRDGSVRWVSENGRAVHDETTGVTWIEGALLDVTDRTQSALRLRTAEDRYRTLVEQLPLITYIDAPDDPAAALWRSRYVSPQVEPMLGWTPEEWLDGDLYFRSVVHPQDRERVLDAHERAYADESGFTLEYRVLTRDGRTRWVIDNMVIARDDDGGRLWSQGYVADITDRKEAEAGLLSAEHRFRTLVEQLPLATYIDDPAGRGTSTYVSPQIEDLLGYAPDEWEPGLFERILHPEDRERVLDTIREATDAGLPVAHEYRVVRRDGQTAWWRDSAVVVSDAEGAPLYRQGFVVDVTAQKQVEAELRAARWLFETFMDNTPGIAFMKDEDGRYVYMNEAMRWLFDVDPDRPDGITDYDFLPPGLAMRMRANDDAVRVTGRDVHVVENVPLPDGSLRHWMTIKFPFVDATGDRFVGGVAVDVTERKEVERELERLLEREREQNAELRTLDRMKDEFVALVSHELRTPLTSIRGYVELLLEGEAGSLENGQAHYLGVVLRNADRLHSLVGDLLFMAQLEAGRITLEHAPVDLTEVAAEAVEAARPLADAKEIALALDADPEVSIDGDRGRLGQLLDNFVSNALKFTPDGGRVEVRIGRESERAVVEISDTGMGIPADEQDRLFERFFRSSTASRNAIQGTGLGLTISKALVEAHGGTIDFTSTEGVGTTFRIELPLTQRLAEAA